MAALTVVGLLLLAMAMMVLYSHRALLFEQKSAANEYRATLAFEAAEAGLEWGTALLNRSAAVDTDCEASTAPGAARWRERVFALDARTGQLLPHAGPLRAACVATTAAPGWRCSCPPPGQPPVLDVAPPEQGFAPGFALSFEPSETQGTVRLRAYGCTSAITSSRCEGDAAAQASVLLATVPTLAAPPIAALTARGGVDAGNAPVELQNEDPSAAGITVRAGRGIEAPNARVRTLPGTAGRVSLRANDRTLGDSTEGRFFHGFFGLPKTLFPALGGVATLACPCDAQALQRAYAGPERVRSFWLEGEFVLGEGSRLGTPQEPVLVVVDGAVRLGGDAQIHGLLYADDWSGLAESDRPRLTGAAIAAREVRLSGSATLVYDASVLRRLQREGRSFVRVPGSWRDF